MAFIALALLWLVFSAVMAVVAGLVIRSRDWET